MLAAAPLSTSLIATLQNKLGEAQRFVGSEVKKLEDTIVTLKAENERLVEIGQRFGHENDVLKNKLKDLQERQRNELRERDARIAGAAKHDALPASPLASPRTELSPKASPRPSIAESRPESLKSFKSGGTRKGDKAIPKRTKRPVVMGPTPESVQLLVSRLKSAAYSKGGCRLDAKFFKRLDKDGNGELDCDEWIKALRKELKLNPRELSDEQAKQIFLELDMDGSNALAIDELKLLVEVAAAEKGVTPDGKSLQSADLPPSLIHKVIHRLRDVVYKDNGVDIDEAFLYRIDSQGKGYIDSRGWMDIVRKELKLSTHDVPDQQCERIFGLLHDGKNGGHLGLWNLLQLVRAVPPASAKPRSAMVDRLVACRELPPESIARFLSRLKQLLYSGKGINVDSGFFQKLDRNGTGKIDLQEWFANVRVEMKLLENELSNDGVEKIFLMLDESGNGHLELSEIMNLSREIHEVEDKKLKELVANCKRVQNVCRLLTRSQQLTFDWQGTFFEAEFQAGHRVKVCKLVARCDLNGLEGIVMDFDQQAWRYKVCLDDGARMCFSPKNLRSTESVAKSEKPLPGDNILFSQYGTDPSVGSPGAKILKQIALLIEERKERISDFFRKVDKDADGILTRREVRLALENLGIAATRDDFSDLMAIVDTDGGGDISMKELAKAIHRAMRGELDHVEAKIPSALQQGSGKPKERGSVKVVDAKESRPSTSQQRTSKSVPVVNVIGAPEKKDEAKDDNAGDGSNSEGEAVEEEAEEEGEEEEEEEEEEAEEDEEE